MFHWGRGRDPEVGETYGMAGDRKPWEWESPIQLAITGSIATKNAPAEDLAMIRPPLPEPPAPLEEISYDNTPSTIEDILDIGRWSPERRSWVSPTVRMAKREGGSFEGSARNYSTSIPY